MQKDKKIEKFIAKIFDVLKIKTTKEFEHLCTQIFKFLIVGGIATIIDWIIYYIMSNIFNISPFISNVISFSVAVIYNYRASIKWIFVVNKQKYLKRIFFEFIILSIVGLLLTEILLFLFINIFNIKNMVAKIAATIIVMIFNFVTRKIFLE